MRNYFIRHDKYSSINIDGVNGDKDIDDLFSDKYNRLYNSVPFDNDDMQKDYMCFIYYIHFMDLHQIN